VERFQQTLKNWLRAHPLQPATVNQLQMLLDEFIPTYNQHRPHRSLPHRATPATIYNTLPKATPTSDRTDDTHDRVRHDKIDDGGAVTLRANGRTTSASDEPTPEPPSSCSFKTSTSESSTRPPANYSASSPSTPDATTSPPDDHPDHAASRNNNSRTRGTQVQLSPMS